MNPDVLVSPGLGRRIEIRYVCDLLATCSQANSPPVPASVIDISRTGVGLLVSQPFQQGSIISLDLPLAGGTVHACVFHVAAEPGGWWKMGCRFTEALGGATFESLWKTAPDRRTRERFPVDFQASYENQHCFGSATVIDISTRGLCLLVNRPLDVGTTLELRIHGATFLDTAACVVRVRQEEASLWTCGCSFTHELTDAQLLGLLEQSFDRR